MGITFKGLTFKGDLDAIYVGGDLAKILDQLCSSGGETNVRAMSHGQLNRILAGVPTKEEGAPLIAFIILPGC